VIKKLPFLFFIFFFFFFNPVFAAGFSLKSIGSLNTEGKVYPQWWYTGLQPTFTGEAPANSTINIAIDNNSYQASANGSGEWSFTPPAVLTAGDHTVALTNNESSLNFTLTLGSEGVNWDRVASGAGETLPTAGITLPTVILLSSGLGLIFLGKKSFS
jgi:hypothetical protein